MGGLLLSCHTTWMKRARRALPDRAAGGHVNKAAGGGAVSGDEEELDAIWAEYRQQTAERLEVIRRVALSAAAGSLDDELRQAGIAEAHTLAGAASIFGFPEGTRLAREIERRLRDPAATDAGLPGLAEALTLSLDRDRDARKPGD